MHFLLALLSVQQNKSPHKKQRQYFCQLLVLSFMKNILLLLLFLLSIIATAQVNINGQVVDSETKEGIAFATILFKESKTGIATDIDGFYKFSANFNAKQLRFSSIGYESKPVRFEQLKAHNYIISLKKSSYNIDEVEILPGENPAHRIINKAIENRKKNNPELSSPFFYESYNKMVFTTPMDTNSRSTLDSITIRSIQKDNVDSFPDSKVGFIMESVSQRNHYPPTKSYEVVTESRISGLKTPFFSLLATQLQSFSLYQDYIMIYGINYLSPISNGGTSKYLFVLEDTIFHETDTSFIISFRPKRNKNFKSLQGVMTINTNGFAVENFVSKQYDSTGFPVKVQQRYELIENTQWFPTQLHIDIVFVSADQDDFSIMGKGKTYIRDISLQPKIEEKELGNLALSMDDEIVPKGEVEWKELREIPLSKKELLTYQFIDSIGEKENLDRLVFLTKGLVNGYIPVGKFNLMIDKFLKFNEYESVRLGAGVETGEGLFGPVRIAAFGGYGFKDKAWKYGSHVRWVPKNNRQFETKFAYSNDLIAVGRANFFKANSMLFSGGEFQNFINDQFDTQENWEGSVSFRALRDFHFTFFGNQQTRDINSTYQFISSNGELVSSFSTTEVGVNFRFSFNEKFGEIMGVTIPLETNSPVIHFKYSKGLAELDGDFEYEKVDLSFSKKFTIRNAGTTSLQADFGYVSNSIPLTALYSLKGIFNKDVRVASNNSFETMAPNEFFADRQMSLFFRHNFGSLLFNQPKFKPELLLISSFGLGSLQNRDSHINFDFSVAEKGFLESGIQFNSLYRMKYFYEGVYLGFGVGVYYRYGAYANNEFIDNIALKLTATFSM